MSIWNPDSGNLMKACDTGTVCQWSHTYVGGGARTYVALDTVADPAGLSWADAAAGAFLNSGQVSVDHAPWSVTLAADKTVFPAGEHVTLTATANQDLVWPAGTSACGSRTRHPARS